MTALHVPRTASDEGVIDAAKKALGDTIVDVKNHVGEITLTVKRDQIANVLKLLRDSPGLEYQLASIIPTGPSGSRWSTSCFR
jgi:NADH-quinone oxidoreductase subunit C